MERVEKTDKSFQFFFGAGCGPNQPASVGARSFKLAASLVDC